MRSVLLVLVCLCVSGCVITPAPKYESYHPAIPDLRVYPGFKDRQAFWDAKAKFYAAMREKKQYSQDDTVALIKQLFDVDTVLESREAQIAEYNKWAQAENEKHGYKKPQE